MIDITVTAQNENGDKATTKISTYQPPEGALTNDVMDTLKKQASSKSVMKKDGPIFCETFYKNEATVTKLEEQLKENNILYEGPIDGVFKIIGATDENGKVLAKAKPVKVKPDRTPNKPTDGKWVDEHGNKAERGHGRYFPDPEPTVDKNGNLKYPSGHPQNLPANSKKAETQRQNNKERAKIEVVDQVLPMYDSKGNPIRYKWGEPGAADNEKPINSLIGQIELFVRGHRKRHEDEYKGKPEYVFQGVLFENGYPVMDEFSMGTVDMDFFTSNRDVNFKNADERMAYVLNKKWEEKPENKGKKGPYTADAVKKYREDNDLTWHEDPSRQKMMKVPTLLHANISHTGGISEETTLGQDLYYDRQKVLANKDKGNVGKNGKNI